MYQFKGFKFHSKEGGKIVKIVRDEELSWMGRIIEEKVDRWERVPPAIVFQLARRYTGIGYLQENPIMHLN